MAVLLFVGWNAFAQRTVTGKVTDANGEALIGVNVLERGTSNGTISDVNGNYSVSVQDNAVLVFSFIGYTTVSETVGTRSVINLTLAEDATTLSEVVVSALGFAEEKDKIGATSSIINSSDVVRSGEANLINGLGGKAAGVRVARSNGDPGAGSNIQIRGFNTIGGGSQPLIIVDGIPISNASENGFSGSNSGGTSQQSRLNDLNPQDIESVTVLKGASAASLWGSRAANGVIVITTKKGKAGGKVNISYSGTYSMDKINKEFPTQTTFGQGTGGRFVYNRNNAWGDKIANRPGGNDIPSSTDYFEAPDGTKIYRIASGTVANPSGGKVSQTIHAQDNFDEIFQTGHFFENNLSISGGGTNGTFFFSLGDLNQEGIIRNSDYRRTTVRLNSEYQFNNWISMSAKATYARTKSNRIQQSSNVNGVLLGLLRTPADFDNTYYKGTYYNTSGGITTNAHRMYRNSTGESNPAYNNPLWTINDQESPSNVDRFIMATDITLTPLSWLTFIARGGADIYQDRRESFFPVNTAGSSGELENEVILNRELNFDGIVKASHRFGDNIGGDLTVGFNVNDRARTADYVYAQNALIDTDLRNLQNYTSLQPENSKRYIRSNRLYFVAGLDFYDQIFVNLSGVSERASSIKDSFFYPSGDVAWQFTKLAGLESNSILSFGKLRLGYGQVGVQPSAHRFETTYESFGYNAYDDGLDSFNNGGGFRLNDDAGNPTLNPEIKTEFEIGTDLRFFKDKLSVGLTYYSNEINDLLLDVSLAPSGGFNNIYANAGSMTNKGLEIDFGYDIFTNQDWKVNLYGNFNNNRNKVTDLSGTSVVSLTTQSIQAVAIVGQPMSSLYGTKALRDANGDFVLDANGFPQIASEQGIIGDPNPDWRGGLGIRASYKGLSLNVLFETFQGADYADRTRFVLYAFGTHSDVGNEVTLTEDLKNRAGATFTAGTTVRGNILNYGGGNVLGDESWYTSLGGGLGGSAINEFAIADGSWTRLREVSLSYSLPRNLVQKAKLSSVDFTVTGRNLALWTDIQGIDPEINQSGVDNAYGIDYFTNPSTQSILFSVRINY